MKKKQSKKKIKNKKKNNYSETTAFANLEKTSNTVTPHSDPQVAYLNMLPIEWREEYFLLQEYRQ